jgi:hypothetical protein
LYYFRQHLGKPGAFGGEMIKYCPPKPIPKMVSELHQCPKCRRRVVLIQTGFFPREMDWVCFSRCGFSQAVPCATIPFPWAKYKINKRHTSKVWRKFTCEFCHQEFEGLFAANQIACSSRECQKARMRKTSMAWYYKIGAKQQKERRRRKKQNVG